jgi:transposase-like protein
MLNTKGMRFPIDVILVCIRWCAAYPLSYRHLQEMMQERGVNVDHSTINRWAIRFLPLLEKAFRKYKRPVGVSWRMDATYIKVNGQWKYLYRAVEKAMQANGIPEKVTMDKSGANKSAIDQVIEDKEIAVEVRQIKYLNNIALQDHRAVKRNTRPMLGFKSFRAAASVLAGIELMHMIRKGQMAIPSCEKMSFANQFYALAGQVRPA